jgi:hypothetical protein
MVQGRYVLPGLDVLAGEVRLGILRLRNHQLSEAEAAFLDLVRTADSEAALRGRRFLAAHGFDAPD